MEFDIDINPFGSMCFSFTFDSNFELVGDWYDKLIYVLIY